MIHQLPKFQNFISIARCHAYLHSRCSANIYRYYSSILTRTLGHVTLSTPCNGLPRKGSFLLAMCLKNGLRPIEFRSLATVHQESVMNVFDRRTKRTQRNRTAFLEEYNMYDYLKEENGWRVADRLFDVKRKFDVALDLGCGRGHIGKNVLQETVGVLVQCDLAEKVLSQSCKSPEVPTSSIVADEEFLPFRENSFDLVVSSLSLHWVNNLPGTFRQIQNILKNDGCFIGSLFGGETLHELRVSLYLAEMEREGGFAAHVSPFTSAQDLGGLLNQAGFVMLTIDVDEIVVNYPSILELMFDLKGMGENNCAWSRRPMLKRETIMAAAAIYQEKFGNKSSDDSSSDANKGIPAVFQILNFIAWKPDPSQLRAAERGSGEISLKDIERLGSLTKEINELKKQHDQKDDERTKKTIAELEKSIDKALKSGQPPTEEKKD